MKFLRTLLLLSTILMTTGCIRSYFQPVPPSYLLWTAPGKTVLDVKKSLLECGIGNPSGMGVEYDRLTENENAAVQRCMENIGYIYKYGKSTWCKNRLELKLPVCAPDAIVPKPNAELRLQSNYCHAKRSYTYCKENAVNPAACERMNFSKPPPECLP